MTERIASVPSVWQPAPLHPADVTSRNATFAEWLRAAGLARNAEPWPEGCHYACAQCQPKRFFTSRDEMQQHGRDFHAAAGTDRRPFIG